MRLEARRTARRYWPNAALHGQLSQELPLPQHFEQATKDVTEDEVAEMVLCGNDPDAHKERIEQFVNAGFDHVYVHQVGPDQEAFFKFYASEILPAYL